MTRPPSLTALMLVCLSVVVQRSASAQTQTDAADGTRPLLVQVVDDQGSPIEGASVGMGGEYFSDTSWLPEKSAVSDEKGNARLEIELRKAQRACLVAHQHKRGLIGFASVNPNDWPDRIKLVLGPERRVTGRMISTGLEKRNERLFNAEIAVLVDGKAAVRHWSIRGDVALYLPPGKYELDAHSNASPTHDVVRSLVVPRGNTDVTFGEIDLPLTRLKELEGRPAPELRDIVGWMNSKPLKLSDLRGKVVLLDFWGWWCGACTVGMPELFELHDKYHKDGLVIIGIHIDLEDDSSVDTAEEMYEKVAADRKEYWKGREIPFPVAFVRSESKRVPFLSKGATGTARCELAAQYGVDSYPTQVVIDREGRVVTGYSWGKALEKTLGVEP
jgi:thiol-disulfide isomerase/thioredoxin